MKLWFIGRRTGNDKEGERVWYVDVWRVVWQRDHSFELSWSSRLSAENSRWSREERQTVVFPEDAIWIQKAKSTSSSFIKTTVLPANSYQSERNGDTLLSTLFSQYFKKTVTKQQQFPPLHMLSFPPLSILPWQVRSMSLLLWVRAYLVDMAGAYNREHCGVKGPWEWDGERRGKRRHEMQAAWVLRNATKESIQFPAKSREWFSRKHPYAWGVQATWTDHLYMLHSTARLDFPGHGRISSLQCEVGAILAVECCGISDT